MSRARKRPARPAARPAGARSTTPEPTARQLEIAAFVVAAREHARRTLGDRYAATVKPYRDSLEATGLDPLTAALPVAKRASEAGDDPTVALVLSAAADLIDARRSAQA